MSIADFAMWMILDATNRAASWAHGAEWQAVSKWWKTRQYTEWCDRIRLLLYLEGAQ